MNRLEISKIGERENNTLIEQVVKVNLEDEWYSKLHHFLKTGQINKKFTIVIFLIFLLIQEIIYADIVKC